MSNNNITIGTGISSLRAERGWSKTELAARAAIDLAQIVRLESGAAGLGQRRAERLARAFGVPTSFLKGIGAVDDPPVEGQDVLDSESEPEGLLWLADRISQEPSCVSRKGKRGA
jgi:transcriptional regulator with XRE-family HTH domain